MKIHIVQKGDTLWNLSKKYNVDFQALKNANSQLANPDLIMPGMKIKIPVDKKQVVQSPSKAAPKEKVMMPYKQIPQKAQPVIKEDDQLPKKKVEKKVPLPKLPPMSINMPKLPNIHAHQYNIDVDIDDHDTVFQNKQVTHPQSQPVQQQAIPEKKAPIQDKELEIEKTEWSKKSMMLMPVMPYPMMYYPPCSCQQPYQYMPAQNPCITYQDPSKLTSNYPYQQQQVPVQKKQSYAQWGELNVDDQSEQTANQQYAQEQWPANYYNQQAYPYQYPTYGTQGYQNYANYAPRDNSNQQSDQNSEEN